MSVTISNNFKVLYDDVKEGISISLQKLRKEYPNIDKVVKTVTELIEGEFSSKGQLESQIAGLLTQISVMAYFQEFDNDKNYDKLKSYYTEIISEKKDSPDETESSPDGVESTSNGVEGTSDKEGSLNEKRRTFANIELDFKFGFHELLELIQAGVEQLEMNEVGGKVVEGKLTANLLSNIRDISPDEYLEKGYIEKDLALITLLNERPEEEVNGDIIDFINSNHDLNTLYLSATDSILGVYKYAFQDSFGLRPYVGVLSFNGDSIYTIGDDFHLSTLPNALDVFKKVASELRKSYKVKQSNARQFDFDTIVESDRPVYFPKKILEYALGRRLTYELSLNLYKPIENVASWEQYEEKYVRGQVKGFCLTTVYKSLERNTGYDFNSPEFKKKWTSNNKGVISKLESISIHDSVKSDMQKVIKSLCTGVIITKYNSLNDSVNSIKIRVVDVFKNLSLKLTANLFSSFSSNNSISYYDGLNISEGKKLSDGNTPLPYNIIEYGHDFNEKLSEAEPLFGYTAVRLFQARGIPISWNRILLGEDIKGTPIFADVSDQDGIPMQENVVHNMMAGSRAGKGVMTMNILATGLVSEKPIFYIDRKPDMAVMFYELTGGNMFVINGGQYEIKNDPRSIYNDTGEAIKGWDDWYDNMPKYLKEVFPRSYQGDFGDYVYFRAMLFCICLILTRSAFVADAEIYNKLGGQNGVIFVFDEFKNWQQAFEVRYASPNGVFGQHRIDKEMRSQYEKNKDKIEDRIDSLNSGDLKPERAKAYEREVKRLKATNKQLVKPIDAYCHTFMDKYGKTLKAISSLLSAGFKDGEAPKTDIFVIGQNIKTEGFQDSSAPSGTYPETASGRFCNNSSTRGKSLMRGLLDSFFHDWFMGHNEDGAVEKKYMGASVEGSEAKRLIMDKCYWGYVNGASIEELTTSTPSNTIYFKPYLVLNNAMEDDPAHPQEILGITKIKQADGTEIEVKEKMPNPDYTFVAQCRNRVNKAVPNLWETIRLKHLAEGYEVTDDNKWYGHLNEGIGFEGLANEICKTQGKVLDKQSSLAGSKAIADYVAQQMGYATYKDLLFDFSPEGLFSSDDMIFAVKNGAEAYKAHLKERLPLFEEFGFLDTGEEEEEDTSELLEDDEESPEVNNFDFSNFVEPTDDYNESVEDTSVRDNASNFDDFIDNYYSEPNEPVEEDIEEDEFTIEDAIVVVRNAFQQYDKNHPSAPLLPFVHDYEIEGIAKAVLTILNS